MLKYSKLHDHILIVMHDTLRLICYNSVDFQPRLITNIIKATSMVNTAELITTQDTLNF